MLLIRQLLKCYNSDYFFMKKLLILMFVEFLTAKGAKVYAKNASFFARKDAKSRSFFSQSCHFDEGEIFARSSAIKIINLCRVTCGDFSFVEMTNCTHCQSERSRRPREKLRNLNHQSL